MIRSSTSVEPPPNRKALILGLQVAAGLMMAQQIAGKAARDGLFLQYHGPSALPAMIACAAGFSVLLSLMGGRIMQALPPRTIVPWALGVSGVLQLVEWRLLPLRPGLASVIIYLHMAGVGVVLLSAFWSMLNEEFDPREAKRQFGKIASGGILGGLVGGAVAERTVAWSGAPALMMILAGLHFACGAFVYALMRRYASAPSNAGEDTQPAPSAPHKSSLLVTLGTLVLLGSVGAALLDYVFKLYATETWGRGENLLRVFALFHTGVALLSFVFQSTASTMFLERFGLGKTTLTLPATLSLGSMAALLAPGVVVAGIARGAEAAIRGSLFRAAYETCYTPVPAAEKRLAKAFIDVVSERGGDALGAAIIFACITLAGASAPPWILSIAALTGIASFVICRALDAVYLKALARSLQSRAVQLASPSDLDLTTRSLVLRAPSASVAFAARASAVGVGAETSVGAMVQEDPILARLSALRSSDLLNVHRALHNCDVSDPLIATQVCLLLGRDEHARMAQLALVPAASSMLGLLSDLMLNPALELRTRKRIPRVVALAGGQRAVDALMLGLQDSRFEVRFECARSLARTAAEQPRTVVPADKVMAAVDRELAIGTVLWESHRQQQRDPAGFGSDWLDELIRDKAHGALEYVFTLLSLIYDRDPLIAAFRSLHLEDRHLRGTALEYLEGLLPARTREMLWDILQERPSKLGNRATAEIMNELLKASETVVLRLRAMPGDQRA